MKQIRIKVVDKYGQFIEGANVLLKPEGSTTSSNLQFDEVMKCYFTDEIALGSYQLSITASSFENNYSLLRVKTLPYEKIIVIGKAGDSYTWIDGCKSAYLSSPGRIGIIANPRSVEARTRLDNLISSLELEKDNLDSSRVRFNSYTAIYYRPQQVGSLTYNQILDSLRSSEDIVAAGPIYLRSGTYFSIFTNEILLRFEDSLTREEIGDISTAENLYGSRPIDGKIWIAYFNKSIGEEINDKLQELNSRTGIELAEPHFAYGNLKTNSIVAINDFLWDAMWDRKQVNIQAAFGLLKDNISTDIQFGDPKISIAVIDSGIKSTSGVPDNEDFRGYLSNKVTDVLQSTVAPANALITVVSGTNISMGDNINVGSENGTYTEKVRVVTSAPNPNNSSYTDITTTSLKFNHKIGSRVFKDDLSADTTLTADIERTVGTLVVTSAGNFKKGDPIHIGAQTDALFNETSVVIDIQLPDTLLVLPFRFIHHAGDAIEVGRKVKNLIDYSQFDPIYDNDMTLGDDVHGLACAGVASGIANNISQNSGTNSIGIIGAAPNVQLSGIIYTGSTIGNRNMLQKISGFGADLLDEKIIHSGVDIITQSISAPFDSALEQQLLENLFIRIRRRGRNGKGILYFIAAGNNGSEISNNFWESSSNVFTISASTLDSASREKRAYYSSHSSYNYAGPKVEWCAPSGNNPYYYPMYPNPAVNDPMRNPLITVPTVLGGGDIPGFKERISMLRNTISPAPLTELVTQPQQNDTTLTVVDSTGFTSGMWLVIGTPDTDNDGDNRREWLQVTANSVSGGTTITVTASNIIHNFLLGIGELASGNVQNDVVLTLTEPFVFDDMADAGYLHQGNSQYLKLVDSSNGNQEWVKLDHIVNPTQIQIVGGLNNYVYNPGTKLYVEGSESLPRHCPVLGSTIIDIADVGAQRFGVGDFIMIGNPGEPDYEVVEIKEVLTPGNPNDRRLRISGPLYPHPANTPVYGGPLDYRGDFFGTSSSTPLSAGVAALVLSAKPSLTWIEVADILSKTSVKIDTDTTGFENEIGHPGKLSKSGKWRDVNGDEIVDSNGNLIVVGTQTTLSNSPAANLTTITINGNTSDFSVNQAVSVGSGQYEETTVIQAVFPTGFIVNPLKYNHLSGESFKGGRIVNYSSWYGFGRIDAYNSVLRALGYEHGKRDLFIRDYEGDDGSSITDVLSNAVHSPDIWVRRTANDLQDEFQAPVASSDNWINVRIHNRGTTFDSLPGYKVRLYIALSSGFTPHPDVKTPFYFNQTWDDNVDIHGSTGITSGDEIIYFLEEKDIPIISPLNDVILNFLWEQSLVPPQTIYKTYIIAEITPHDGPTEMNGPGAESNNNISFREILFSTIGFNDQNNQNSLPNQLQVDELGNLVSTPFTIDIKADIGSFRTEKVSIELVRVLPNGNEEKAVFAFDGNWQLNYFNSTQTNWAIISNPIDFITSTPAAGDLTHITFGGSVSASNQHDKIILRALISSTTSDARISEEEFEIAVNTQVLVAQGVSPSAPEIIPKSHEFSDMLLLTQAAGNGFGPKAGDETNKFRVTSSFTATSPVNAYAVTSGFVMVQRDANDTDRINLILRPFDQPILGFTPIKYFIYRGLKLSDFLAGTSYTEVNTASTSEWIQQLLITHNAQNQGGTFFSKALGYDPSNQPGPSNIDSYFFRNDPNFQLPYVARGTQLGQFFITGNNAFGFEIVMSDGSIVADYDFARKQFHEVDITGIPEGNDAEKFTKRLKKEEILSFIDPAAFYGMHFTDKGFVEIRNNSNQTEKKKGQDIYTNIVAAFDTKKKLYIDVRSENSDSYNFYQNYDGIVSGVDNGMHLKVGTEFTDELTNNLAAQTFETFGWPIIIQEAQQNVQLDFNNIYVKLRIEDNLSPILFAEQGTIITKFETPKFVEASLLPGSINPPYANTVGFRFPNTGTSGQKDNIATLLKLRYSRKLNSNTAWPVSNNVVQTNYHADNLFGSVDDMPPWTTLIQSVKWAGVTDSKFVDGSALGFGHAVARGLCLDSPIGNDRVILYATAVENFVNTNTAFAATKGQTDGTDKKDSFFDVPVVFDPYALQFDGINSSPTVKTLTLAEAEDGLTPSENTLILGLTKSEFDSLKILTGLDARYPRNVVLDKIGDFTDVNGKPYSKFNAGINGLDGNGKYQRVFPTTDVVVLTTDELFFSTENFNDAEPLQTSYKRIAEEKVGDRLKHAEKKITIISVDAALKVFTVKGKGIFDNLSPKTPDEIITVSNSGIGNNGTYHIESVDTDFVNTMITVVENVPQSSTTADGELYYAEMHWEDHFLALDQNITITSPVDKMGKIVGNFISAIDVSIIPDNENAPTALENEIDTYAPMILSRARAFVSDNNLSNPDDRILYWARLKMIVALKNHPYLLKSFTDRNKLVKKFDDLSRGYIGVSFGSLPSTTKKVIISGFDPFKINPKIAEENVLRSNPSGACALHLHDKGQTELGIDVKIKSVIFPVRYRDFDDGVVEKFFDQFINGNQVDMIITISQSKPNRYDVERFACKNRGHITDNESKRGRNPKFYVPDNGNLKIEDDPDKLDEFLESNLPITNMVPGTFGNTKVIFNQAFIAKGKERPLTSDTETPKINTPTEPAPEPGHKSIAGSGGNYLSNEIFYRVSLLRNKRTSTVLTGHLHVPQLQTVEDFDNNKTKDLINDVINIIKDAVAGL